MTDLHEPKSVARARVSRRNVVVGTAWATPVVLAVGAAPAATASGPLLELTVQVGGVLNRILFGRVTPGAAISFSPNRPAATVGTFVGFDGLVAWSTPVYDEKDTAANAFVTVTVSATKSGFTTAAVPSPSPA